MTSRKDFLTAERGRRALMVHQEETSVAVSILLTRDKAAEASGSRKARAAKLRDFRAAGNALIKSFVSGTLH